MVKLAMLSICGLGVAVLLIQLFNNPSPERDARVRDRAAIDYCWKQQERKSLAPDEQRFIAGACEMMEGDFQKKYGTAY